MYFTQIDLLKKTSFLLRILAVLTPISSWQYIWSWHFIEVYRTRQDCWLCFGLYVRFCNLINSAQTVNCFKIMLFSDPLFLLKHNVMSCRQYFINKILIGYLIKWSDNVNPNGPELLESLKLRGEGQMAPPPSELTNYNPNAKTDVTLYSQLLKLTI